MQGTGVRVDLSFSTMASILPLNLDEGRATQARARQASAAEEADDATEPDFPALGRG